MKSVFALTALALASGATLALATPQGGQGHPHGQRAAMMERLRAADTNGDGQISRAESATLPRLAERFDAIDGDRDGQLTRQEMRIAHMKHRSAMRFRFLDADQDGKVSKAEALAAAERRFDRMDADGDGFVSPDEARAGRHVRRGEPK